MTHSQIIKNVAINIATLSKQAEDKITNEMLSMASKEMLNVMDDIDFTDYIKMFSDPEYSDYVGDYDRTKEFYLLTPNERKLKKLEMAEAYFLLYYLTIGLKELEESTAISPRTQFGEGTTFASGISDVIRLKTVYYNSAMAIINEVTQDSGMFILRSKS